MQKAEQQFAQNDLIVVDNPSPNTDKIPVGKVGTIVGFAVRFPGRPGLWIVQGDEVRPANDEEREALKAPFLEMLLRDPQEAVRQGLRQARAEQAARSVLAQQAAQADASGQPPATGDDEGTPPGDPSGPRSAPTSPADGGDDPEPVHLA